MYDVVTFGEAMVRLSPPHFQRLEQTRSLDLTVGGAELNVAVGVTRFGMSSAWISRLPKNPLGYLIRDRARVLHPLNPKYDDIELSRFFDVSKMFP